MAPKIRPSQKSVEEIILSLPQSEKIIVTLLRTLVLECLPRATEKVSYGVTIYTHYRMICFIWPPSLFWGHGQTQKKKRR